MKTKQIYSKQTYSNSSNGKTLALLLFPFLSLFGIQSAHAVQVSIGNMVASNITASSASTSWSPTLAFDGVLGPDTLFVAPSGWFPQTSAIPQSVSWDVDPLSRLTLDPGQSVDKYTYTISIHSGYSIDFNLNAFSFSYSNGLQNFDITQYTSLSSNNEGAITADADGLVTADANNGVLAIHTVSFDVTSDIASLTLNVPASAGQHPASSNYVLAEVTGNVVAEVVPEPSTYALITGLASFAWIALRRRKTDKNR